MKFRYTGEAPEGQIEQYGVVFRPGEVSDVEDAFAIAKLKGNAFFEAVGDEPTVDEPVKKRPGRPKKDMTHDKPDDGDAGAVGLGAERDSQP